MLSRDRKLAGVVVLMNRWMACPAGPSRSPRCFDGKGLFSTSSLETMRRRGSDRLTRPLTLGDDCNPKHRSPTVSGIVSDRRLVMNRADIARSTLAPLYGLAGVIHLARPAAFAAVMPHFVPYPDEIIMLTGIAELAGAAGLFVPPVRALAGIMLALYAVCVYPVNIQHAVHDLSTGTGLGWAYHYPRLFAQPLICWWALAAGGLTRQSARRR
jgi:uncharacterized membrane protein